MKTAFLNAVARNGWEHALNKYADDFAAIDFSWDLVLGNEPVRYKFSYAVGQDLKDCNIALEELTSADASLHWWRIWRESGVRWRRL